MLLAHPAGHSLSPAMQGAAFRARGIDADYRAVDVPPERLGAAALALREEAYLGANVSVPHKEAVLELVDEVTPEARQVGAVNTIVREGRRLIGTNTDGAGFMRALAELGLGPQAPAGAEGAGLRGAVCLVLGAGGAARAVVGSLAGAGAEVHVVNRDPERASRLVDELGGGARAHAGAGSAPLREAQLLVNATSVGMEGGPDPHGLPLIAPRDLRALPQRARVVDLVYRPARTPLLRAAEELGLAVQNGLPMLVWQGALSFEAWTGLSAPVGEMRAAAARGLALTPR